MQAAWGVCEESHNLFYASVCLLQIRSLTFIGYHLFLTGYLINKGTKEMFQFHVKDI